MTRKLLLTYTCLILPGIICFAQQKRAIPIKGEIIFSSSSIIPDSSFFVKFLKESQNRLVNHLIKKLGYNDSNIDTTEILSLMGSHISPNMFAEKKDHHFLYKYKGNSIESHQTDGKQKSSKFSIIDPKKSTITDIDVFGDDTVATDPITFSYTRIKEENLQELRNEKRIINGYECFKVIYTYKIDFLEDEDYLEVISNNEQSTATYWVTEKIQSLFHPVCKENSILKKYYPLEISYNDAFHKGLTTIYKLKSINLSY